MKYNWQQTDWPNFKYDNSELEALLFQFVENQGHISGLTKGLPNELAQQSVINMMVAEALKTSAIEGEYLSREDVLSSIRNNLGLNRFPEKVKDRRAEGVARLMVMVRETFAEKLTQEMLFTWHQIMMEPYANIQKGQWRSGDEPMQIISGAFGREIVHFEAPPSSLVPQEMESFFHWYNEKCQEKSGSSSFAPILAAIAHVYFESIHPFEDGNGRIGRAISEKALSQCLGQPILLSLSKEIEAKRDIYYGELKKAQRSNEITSWIKYFLQTILDAQQSVIVQISFTMAKVSFFDKYSHQLNPRQEKALNRMFEAGPNGFEGGMSAKKYISITKASKATATRDLQMLSALQALIPVGEGRSRRYELNISF